MIDDHARTRTKELQSQVDTQEQAIADLTEKVDKQQVRIETLEMPYTWCYICGSPLVDGKCPCGENTPARTNPRYPREET